MEFKTIVFSHYFGVLKFQAYVFYLLHFDFVDGRLHSSFIYTIYSKFTL